VTTTAATPTPGLLAMSARLRVLSARTVASNWLCKCCLNKIVLTIPMISKKTAVTAICKTSSLVRSDKPRLVALL